MRCFSCFVALALCLGTAPVQAAPPSARVTPLLSHALLDRAGQEGSMLVVDYPPGGADPVHRHNASVFVYVLMGSVVMQVAGGKVVTLHAGQSFFEGPSDVHLIGRNASTTEAARFIAFFVKDRGAPFVQPVH